MVKIAHAQLADTPQRASRYIDVHPLDGQRGPVFWCGDVSAGRRDESELLAWTEQMPHFDLTGSRLATCVA